MLFRKIANSWFDILLCFIIFIALYEGFIVICINMSKYFIEYANHNLSICCDGLCSYINLVLGHHDNKYLFVQFFYSKSKMFCGIKQVIELKNSGISFHEVVNMIVDKYIKGLTEKK